MQLTIVIPTFNEAENIVRLIPVLFSLSINSLRLVVVDDGSPDGTGEITEQMAKDYPGHLSILHRQEKGGIGSAYITGFRHALQAGAEAVAQMDADFSHPPEKLLELLHVLETSDVAMGSRYIPGGSLDDRWPLWRKGLSTFGNFYARSILRLPVRDVTGGFRIWRRETLMGMPLERVRSNGYAFQVEMAYIAYRLGYDFKEVPFHFADRRWGMSKMSINIQLEAARRVWQMLLEYQDLNPNTKAPRSERII